MKNSTKCPQQDYSRNSLLYVSSFLHIPFQHYSQWLLEDEIFLIMLRMREKRWHLRSQRPTCQKNSEEWLISLPLWQLNHNDLAAEASFIPLDRTLQLHCMFKTSVNPLTLQHSISLSARDYEWMIPALQQCTSYEAPEWQPPFSLPCALLHTT